MNILFKKYKQTKGVLFFSYLSVARRLRILTNMPIYHVIGDSHSTCFLHPAFIIHHVGPATAYKLNYQKSTTRGREKVIKILKQICKNQTVNVIFVFGELDTRIHINKAVNEKNISFASAVDSTVKSYFNFLTEIKSKYSGIKIYIFNVLPQGEENNIYNFPYYADRGVRSSIAELMNYKLMAHARNSNFKFINIYDKLVDKNGKRKKAYVFDDVHFNRKIMKFVIEELK